ncbi:MAG: formylglycine-generating enzyme family protein [Gammaproteobacteria bacterium]|nr:formylglycine-generating enzyme family protein [Gammaproteobacteria bacterium]
MPERMVARFTLSRAIVLSAAMIAALAVLYIVLDSGDEPFRDCEACPEMVVVPPGEFVMRSPGSEEGESNDEDPVHRVEIPYRLAVGKYEVTFAEWDACVSDGGCLHRPDDEGWGRGRRPVIHVNWIDAREYVDWLSHRTGEDYRLLSESEWAYAARGGTATAGQFDTDLSPDEVNDGRNQGSTVPVGGSPPNRFGLHDMHGNVREWVEDCWNHDYHGAPSDGSAWTSGDCDYRVFRGGWHDVVSWQFDPEGHRPVDRLWFRLPPGFRSLDLGFRVARTLAR